MSNTAVNICVQTLVWTCPVFLGKTGRNRVVEPHTKSGLTPVPPRPHFMSPPADTRRGLCHVAFLVGVKWYLSVVRVSLVTSSVHVNYWLVLYLLW